MSKKEAIALGDRCIPAMEPDRPSLPPSARPNSSRTHGLPTELHTFTWHWIHFVAKLGEKVCQLSCASVEQRGQRRGACK